MRRLKFSGIIRCKRVIQFRSEGQTLCWLTRKKEFRSGESQRKIKERENIDKYLDLAIKLKKKAKEHDGLVSLFSGISNFVGYLMPKPFF